MRCFLQCASPGIVASSEDCRKFWLCKEEEEGSRVLEVRIWKKITWTCPVPLHILTLQSLLYRCPPGYLFSTVIVRCAKQEEVSCPLDPPPEADFRWTSFLAPTKPGCFCNMFVNILLQGRDHHPAECQPAWRLLCSLGLKIMLGSKIFYIVFVLPCLPFMFCHNLFSAIIQPHLLFCQTLHSSATFVTTQSDHALLCHIYYRTLHSDWPTLPPLSLKLANQQFHLAPMLQISTSNGFIYPRCQISHLLLSLEIPIISTLNQLYQPCKRLLHKTTCDGFICNCRMSHNHFIWQHNFESPRNHIRRNFPHNNGTQRQMQQLNLYRPYEIWTVARHTASHYQMCITSLKS